MFHQEGHEFLFKAALAVMFLLRVDVSDGVGLSGDAYGESAVTFLPSESVAEIVHPFRGCAFDQLYGFSERHGRGQRQENVNVVGGAADGDGFESVLAGDAAEERPEALPGVGGDEVAAVLGGEDDVDEIGDVSVRHRVLSSCGRLRGPVSRSVEPASSR